MVESLLVMVSGLLALAAWRGLTRDPHSILADLFGLWTLLSALSGFVYSWNRWGATFGQTTFGALFLTVFLFYLFVTMMLGRGPERYDKMKVLSPRQAAPYLKRWQLLHGVWYVGAASLCVLAMACIGQWAGDKRLHIVLMLAFLSPVFAWALKLPRRGLLALIDEPSTQPRFVGLAPTPAPAEDPGVEDLTQPQAAGPDLRPGPPRPAPDPALPTSDTPLLFPPRGD